MVIDEKKKVLFITGMEHGLELFIKQETNLNPENTIILQSFGSEISQPYDDLMRNIIIAVYEENVEEIFVVAAKDEQKKNSDILNKIFENKELQGKIKTLDYLFQNCMPEFPERNIRDWLEGSSVGVDHSIAMIRNHPLMLDHVKVSKLLIDKETKKLSEFF